MANKIDDLKASFSDFLRPNMYGVYIFPNTTFLSKFQQGIGMLSHEATFPFYTFTTDEFWYNNKLTAVANKIDYDPAAFSFYVDRDNVILDFFDAWSKQVINHSHQLGYYDDYIARIEVELYDRRLQTVAVATLLDAYPVNIDSLGLGYAQNDEISNLRVTFQFREVEYEMMTVERQSAGAIEQKAKSWRDWLALGNIRRGVNILSKIKNYRRMIENGNVYDAVTNARKIFKLSTNQTSGGYDNVAKLAGKAGGAFKGRARAKSSGYDIVGKASKAFKT